MNEKNSYHLNKLWCIAAKQNNIFMLTYYSFEKLIHRKLNIQFN